METETYRNVPTEQIKELTFFEKFGPPALALGIVLAGWTWLAVFCYYDTTLITLYPESIHKWKHIAKLQPLLMMILIQL